MPAVFLEAGLLAARLRQAPGLFALPLSSPGAGFWQVQPSEAKAAGAAWCLSEACRALQPHRAAGSTSTWCSACQTSFHGWGKAGVGLRNYSLLVIVCVRIGKRASKISCVSTGGSLLIHCLAGCDGLCGTLWGDLAPCGVSQCRGFPEEPSAGAGILAWGAAEDTQQRCHERWHPASAGGGPRLHPTGLWHGVPRGQQLSRCGAQHAVLPRGGGSGCPHAGAGCRVPVLGDGRC